ncbi:ABC-F family ATP-binding cassette domain-containing protein [Weissella minor]|uniref:ATP-binding cassette domain-containing protein n=1 Tax=Weissella minor TaxID=1620 RepID=UPI001BAEE7EC|nr:ATP-binding cassette domain-containing protein [Weissella minor]MBS0949575.1 ABC-F family ATP-binding cassette domain-containing protein [Weissella minor]
MTIKLNNISYTFSDGLTIFDQINFKLPNNEKVALIGDNGTGKTTLLNLIQGNLMPTQGHIQVDGTIEFVPQFEPKSMQVSPGQNQLKRLEYAFSRKADVILLDEPTSNLDKNGIQKVVNLINHYHGIVLVISHDKAFLARVATSVLLIEQAQVKHFQMPYDEFQTVYQSERDRQYREYENKKKTQTQKRKSAEKMVKKANHAKKGKSGMASSDWKAKSLSGKRDKTQKGLAKAAKQLQDVSSETVDDTKPFEKQGLKLLDSVQMSQKVKAHVTFENLMNHDRVLIDKPFSLKLQSGESYTLLGENGSGKTTLLTAIYDDLKQRDYRVNFFRQDIMHNWQPHEKMIDQLLALSGINQQIILDTAGALGITPMMLNRDPSGLSGGQLLKVQLVYQLIQPYDILILDEPTNYLDYDGVEALTDFLQHNSAVLLIVSHDEAFVKQVAQKRIKLKISNLLKDLLRTILISLVMLFVFPKQCVA